MKCNALLQKIFLLVIMITMHTYSVAQKSKDGINQVDTTINTYELQELLKNKSEIKIIDVRLKKDFEADPQLLPTANWHDPNTVEEWAKKLPKNSPIVVYCVHGHKVSQNVASRLLNLGYNVQFLEGGIHAWKELGGKTLLAK